MNYNLPNYAQKYMNKHSYNKWDFYSKETQKFKTIVVIPAIAEYENIKALIKSLSENDSTYFNETLFLFVINNQKNASSEILIDNHKSLNYLKQLADKLLSEITPKLNINLIDASSNNFELDDKNGGVGLARKIGMDLSLNLFNYETESKNIIVCLDADCTVEENYITTIRNYFNNNSISAGYVNFKHTFTDDIENERAIINYEIFLRYYVLGLKFANSHYAYHSIGSTMICDVESYVKVQGMNKRKAAEDFYFMEKLSKITKIQKIDGTSVLPSSRGSWRVPFGTGQRVNRFLDKIQNEYLLYSPKSFAVLKDWIFIFYSDSIFSAEEYLAKAKKINNSLFTFLIDNNFTYNWNKIAANSSTAKQLQNQKHLWFDGFRTLKLIHYLRDVEFKTINMFNALDELFSNMDVSFKHKNVNQNIPSIEIQKEYLTKLREIA
ncbi:MAG: glycosyltransferase family 2 protein [Bacteroidetes bacterium]|nr:glycosyltransferase family 2 protein [Bacteroidota bacterium]MBU1117281.1 glycosyltransferase family 2 protein [Bacteroidota bacterium]MBU1797379.1 glycosyltransferase family 2 protein [Bacteroidota bacterium]